MPVSSHRSVIGGRVCPPHLWNAPILRVDDEATARRLAYDRRAFARCDGYGGLGREDQRHGHHVESSRPSDALKENMSMPVTPGSGVLGERAGDRVEGEGALARGRDDPHTSPDRRRVGRLHRAGDRRVLQSREGGGQRRSCDAGPARRPSVSACGRCPSVGDGIGRGGQRVQLFRSAVRTGAYWAISCAIAPGESATL